MMVMMMSKRKIPEHLISIFNKNIEEKKLNDAVVLFILDNKIGDSVVYQDISEEFALVMALHRLYKREIVCITESRVSKIVKKKKVVKKDSVIIDK